MNNNKSLINILFILFLITAYCQLANATIRYVSHTGTSTPPYTTWENAADSIQKCINICVFGDTIYVANGVYEEQVTMIDGLSLIGAGMDSSIIDTRNIIDPASASVYCYDYCYISGFQILALNPQQGGGIVAWADCVIEFNNIKQASVGIILTGVSDSVSIIRNNIIEQVGSGIDIATNDINAKPSIEDNILRVSDLGIRVIFRCTPTIRNNTIILGWEGARGIQLGDIDSAFTNNNLIISNATTLYGINNSIKPIINANNFLIGTISYRGIDAENLNVIKNNVIMNSEAGIVQDPGENPIIQYNNSWNNQVNYSGFNPDTTNLSIDPMIVSEDSLDFHLQMFSPLIDAGDPNILDIDGSRSDIGLFGGPYGEIYTYQDLAPKPPKNLTAEYDSGLVKLTWDRNTEADFFRYRIYRDTVANFIYDITKLIAVTADTFYYDDLPEKYIATDYYYKLTAIDSTGHQSAASEEVQVIITGAPEGPPIIVEEYKLLHNYPNPFNPRTTIPYRLKEGGYVKLIIYGITGEIVTYLVNEYQPAGYHEVVFEPSPAQREMGKFGDEFATGYNDDIASGIYLYQIIIIGDGNRPVFTDMGKMILLK